MRLYEVGYEKFIIEMLWSESGVTAVARWTWGLGASHADSETVVTRWTISLEAALLSTVRLL